MLEEEYEQRRVLPRHLQPPPEPDPGFAYTIRDAVEADLPNVREIYNHYVMNSTVTFDEKPMALDRLRAEFLQYTGAGLPYLVAESPSGQVLGYAYAYPVSTRTSSRRVVQDSIYLGPAAGGRGLGKRLLGELLARCRAAGVREVVAVIADKGADASIRLHEGYGFTRVSEMGKVGFKFGRWLGTVNLRLKLR